MQSKCFKETQWTTRKQKDNLTKLGTNKKQNKKFTKEIKNIFFFKMNKKNSGAEEYSAWNEKNNNGINIRMDQTEEIICELYRNFKIIQSEKNKEKKSEENPVIYGMPPEETIC